MNPLWLIIIVLAMFFMQSKLYERFIFKGLTMRRHFDSLTAFPGEEVMLELEIVNRKLLPITWLHIEQKFPLLIEFGNIDTLECQNRAEMVHGTDMGILPYQRVNRSYHVKCVKRGFFELKEARLESTNLFGTKKYRTELASTAALTIYPRLVDIKRSLIPANSMQGDILVRRWIMEDPLMIAGAREYTTSDDFRSINWKATAKHAKLKVNRYDYTADKKIMLLFDVDICGNLWKGFDPDAIENGIEVCASVAEVLVREGIPVGLATNAIYAGDMDCRDIGPGTGEKQLMDILEMLARVQYYRKFEFSELLETVMSDISWGTELVIVAPVLDEQLRDSLVNIRGVKITLIALKQECQSELPDSVELFIYDSAGEQYEAV